MKTSSRAIEILNAISTVAVHERNINKIMDSVLDILSREMGMHRATFTLCQHNVFQIEVSRGLDEE